MNILYPYESMVKLGRFFDIKGVFMSISDKRLDEIDNETLEKGHSLAQKALKKISKMSVDDAFIYLNNNYKDINKKISLSKNFSREISDYIIYDYIVSVDELKSLILKGNSIDKREKYQSFYRGVSNEDYNLISSYDRKTSTEEEHSFKTLMEKYKSINNEIAQSVECYELSALMQHYLQLSPLIDFTEDINIALYFSLFDYDCGNFHKPLNNIALYEAIIPKQMIIASKEMANELIQNYTMKTTIDEIKKILPNEDDPRAKLINIKVNDRMRVQKGVFLYLNNGLCRDNRIEFVYLQKDFILKKHIIKKEVLIDCFDEISNLLRKYRCIEDVEKYLKYHMYD